MREPWVIIPHVRRTLGAHEWTEIILTDGFCQKDKVQWFFETHIREGYHEREMVQCPCCGGSLLTYSGDGGITTSESLEVVACLKESSDGILFLVLFPTASATARDALLLILEKLDFSASYSEIRLIQSPDHLSLTQKTKNKNLLKWCSKLTKYTSVWTKNEAPSKSKENARPERKPKDLAAPSRDTPQPFWRNSKTKTKNSTEQLLKRLQQSQKSVTNSLQQRKQKRDEKNSALLTMGRSFHAPTNSQEKSSAPPAPSTQTTKIPSNGCSHSLFKPSFPPRE